MVALSRALIFGLIAVILLGTAFAQPPMTGKIPITTSSEDARQLFIQGRDLAENFRNVEARAAFEQAVAKDPNFALAYWGLALVQPNTKLFRESMSKAVSLVGTISECERNLIMASQAAGEVNLADQRKFLGQLAAHCPQDERSHMNFALYFFGRQYYDSAATELQTATTLAPSFTAAWNMLGYAHRNAGDMTKAEQAFQKYVELDPKNANAHDSYAELLLKQGRYDEAVRHYREALAVDSTFALSHFNMAAPLVYQGKYDEARRELNIMRAHARDDGQRQTAYFGLAMVALDQGKLDDAVVSIQLSDGIDKKNNDVAQQAQNAIIIGLIRIEQSKFADALTQFQRVVDLTKNTDLAPTFKALMERARLYGEARVAAREGDPAKAKQLADSFAEKARATGSIDDLRGTHELYGVLALDAKQYATAVDELKQANQQDAQNLYRLAVAYEGAGNHAEAVKAIKAAVTYNGLLNLNNVIMRRKTMELAARWGGK